MQRARFAFTAGSPLEIAGPWEYVMTEGGAVNQMELDPRVEARASADETLFARSPAHVFYTFTRGLAEAADASKINRVLAKAIVDRLLS